MSNNSTPFITAYNAKVMTFEQVARSFVWSDKYDELAGLGNCVLVGPRGSGKTTLLKMLSLPGLRAWNGQQGDQYRQAISYTGIYVPSDIAWGEMVNALGNGLLHKEVFELVAEAAFTTNVLISTLTAIQQRLEEKTDSLHYFHHVQLNSDKLIELIDFIANIWKLQLRAPTFRSLQTALAGRLLDIHQKSIVVSHRADQGINAVYELMPYVGLPPLMAVSEAVRFFDDLIGDPDGRWALLLDEFEVAPLPLQRIALTALRASSPKLLIKVAIAPCGPHTLLDLDLSNLPTNRNDYQQVELWYSDKGEADKFCRRVFAARAREDLQLKGMDAEEVFGESQYAIVDEAGEGGGQQLFLSREVQWAREFSSLAEKDSSFAAFLDRKQIDLSKLDPSPQVPNGNTIRKVAPVVAFRNAYKGKSDGKKRGRKSYTSAYIGWQALAAISEGNPRWLLGMLRGIFAEMSPDQRFPIPASVQQKHAASTAGMFAEMLRTVAGQQTEQTRTTKPVFQVLERIGAYFHKRMILDSFTEDPPMSFVVDDAVTDDDEACLRIALNHGAIVCYESPDSLGGFKTLRGKRFRLAYLLSPVFQLPVRKSKHVRLSSILNPPPEKNEQSPLLPTPPIASQGTLF